MSRTTLSGRAGDSEADQSGTWHSANTDGWAVAAAVLVVLQLAAVVVFGAWTIARAPLWAPIDEGAHYENVIYVAQHGSFPILGKTLAGEQELAISQGLYPRHTTIDATAFGLGGLAYEAFQPPLYYYVAAPVTYLSSNYHTKAVLLRVFGLCLLLASVALTARLSRRLLGRRWVFGLAASLVVFLMPGVIVRMVTISNLALAVPLAILTLTELWITWTERAAPSWRLAMCGLLVGLCVLTDLYLAELLVPYIAVAAATLWLHRRRRTAVIAVSGAAAGTLAVVPWIASNLATYHAVTATALARVEQTPIVNPHHLHHSWLDLPRDTLAMLFGSSWSTASPTSGLIVPQEWGPHLLGRAGLDVTGAAFSVVLVVVPALFVCLAGRRALSDGSWVPVVALGANVALSWFIEFGQQWSSMIGRYLYPTLAPFVLAGVVAGARRFDIRKGVVAIGGVLSGYLVVLWAFLVPIIHAP